MDIATIDHVMQRVVQFGFAIIVGQAIGLGLVVLFARWRRWL